MSSSLATKESLTNLYQNFVDQCAKFKGNLHDGDSKTNKVISKRIDMQDMQWLIKNYRQELYKCLEIQSVVLKDLDTVRGHHYWKQRYTTLSDTEKEELESLQKKLSLVGLYTDCKTIGYTTTADTQLPIIWPHEWFVWPSDVSAQPTHKPRYYDPQEKCMDQHYGTPNQSYRPYEMKPGENLYILSSIDNANYNGQYRMKIRKDPVIKGGKPEGGEPEYVYFMPISIKMITEFERV